MPYSGPDDPDLPDYVKAMNRHDREQWVAVFNSAYERCMEEEDDEDACESSAFAQANGVLAKQRSIWETIGGLVRDLLTERRKSADPGCGCRALDVHGTLLEQLQAELTRRGVEGWLHGVYVEDERIYAVVSQEGRLLRYPIIVLDDVVTLGEPEAVRLSFVPRTHVLRAQDGQVRWVSISCTAILNRVGEIDSTRLFDDMIRRAQQTGKWPERQIYHLGAKFRTGQVDGMWRDGVTLITTGVWDDTELARAEIAALEREPEAWGESIRYRPLAVERVRVDEVEIPVFTAGEMIEVSLVPRERAAALHTQTKMEGRTMREDILAVLRRLFNGDEKKVEEFAALVDEVNARAAEPGVIARSETVERRVEGTEDESAEAVPAPAIDVAQILSRLDQLEQRLGDLGEQLGGLTERCVRLERSDEEKIAERVADMSRKQRTMMLATSYRPSRDAVQEEDGTQSLSDIAQRTLQRLRGR